MHERQMSPENGNHANIGKHTEEFTITAESDNSETQRSRERKWEDNDCVPVILKRSDEAVRHPDDILEKAIMEGAEQIRRPFASLALSSLAAGIILGFTAMVAAVVYAHEGFFENPLSFRLATAMVYPLGFVVCIMSGTQLFTEHTAKAIYPFLEGKAGSAGLLRLWTIIIIGNILGTIIIAVLLTFSDGVIEAKEGYIELAYHFTRYGNAEIFISSLLAGCLMAQGGWLVFATPPNISQIVGIYIVTFLIGIGQLHHSIAGSAEMFTALFISDQFTLPQVARCVGMSVIGNLFGGSVFVGALNYAHIRKTQKLAGGSRVAVIDS